MPLPIIFLNVSTNAYLSPSKSVTPLRNTSQPKQETNSYIIHESLQSFPTERCWSAAGDERRLRQTSNATPNQKRSGPGGGGGHTRRRGSSQPYVITPKQAEYSLVKTANTHSQVFNYSPCYICIHSYFSCVSGRRHVNNRRL